MKSKQEFIPPFHDQKSFLELRGEIENKGALGVRIISDSMTPVLNVDELITVRSLSNYQTLTRFVPILYWDGAKLICHYVWHLSKKLNADGKLTVITRSLKDYRNDDIPVPVEHILGTVEGKTIPFGTKIKIILSNILR
ncbi:MAG: hypothetical protein KC493_02595 [Bacteriovoracaceae bacterium]|nr:hypothetical protein [Bacteriovoracaceae bacterium]